MKALSVRQPWADMICTTEKTIEFRSRPTKHRGDLVICSSKYDAGYVIEIDGETKALPLGYMLAVTQIIDCRLMTQADTQHAGAPSAIDGWYAWILAKDVDILIPKPVTGRVNMFHIPDELIESAPLGKYWYNYL